MSEYVEFVVRVRTFDHWDAEALQQRMQYTLDGGMGEFSPRVYETPNGVVY